MLEFPRSGASSSVLLFMITCGGVMFTTSWWSLHLMSEAGMDSRKDVIYIWSYPVPGQDRTTVKAAQKKTANG